jgi:filamentous hemagglutinin family protein
MLQTGMRGLLWAIARSTVLAITLTIGWTEGAIAQIVPDQTLGNERSQVTLGTVGNQAADRIGGGARRGSSLFHSFRSFNIGAGQRAYFDNPTGIRNILSRVTGNGVSNILGTLGVEGNANLFLLNPNGIVFGQNARLDMQGSFLATTADRFVFPNQITFGAVNPEAPPLLNVTVPIGLQYGRNPGAIVSQARLAVDSGRSLVLAGGAIDLTNGRLDVNYPQGGRIDLGSVGNAGTIGLDQQGNLFSLSFPANLERADISLRNSVLDVTAANGGDIAITGRSINVGDGSEINAGIAAGYGFKGNEAGDITIGASRVLHVEQASLITNRVAHATDTALAAIGNAGNIYISTGALSVGNGSQLQSSSLGHGNSGDIIIKAHDYASFNRGDIFSSVGGSVDGQVLRASGRGGDIRISTGSLSIRNGAQLQAEVFGDGNAGSIVINARDRVLFDNGDAFTSIGGFSSSGPVRANGRGGDIRISTGSLLLRNRSQIDTSLNGSGISGSVIINARNQVDFDHSRITSGVGGFAEGQENQVIRGNGRGGDIFISTGSLSLYNQSQLDTSTVGRGNAGNIIINARDQVALDGRSAALSSAGQITTGSERVLRANGRGGNVQISTEVLSLTNGSQLMTNTIGQGSAGNVIIDAGRQVSFNNSGAISSAGRISDIGGQIIGASGQGGNIDISTRSLLLVNSAQLVANTFGRGNAGNVTIRASDQVDLEGINSGIVSSSGGFHQRQAIAASGRGGDVRISTNKLSLSNGVQVGAEGTGNGNAGNILLNANQVTLDRGTITTTNRSRNGGNITLQNADLLTLLRGSSISTSARANGNGGNITLNANLIAASANDNNDITANAFNGRGGAVNITGQLAGISLLSRNELQVRLGTTNSQNLDPSDLPTNDITAISQNAPTLNGQVTVNHPNVDPSRGLIQLPTVPIDATNRIASACPTNTQQADRLGSFIVSGRGGLPPSPTDLLSNDNVLTEWVTPNPQANHAAIEPPVVTDKAAIVEAQGWVKDANGEIRLVAADPAAASAPNPPCVPNRP